MVQLIIGNKGKGKTKHLLHKVNADVKTVSGTIVYLDKSTKHMYELNNKIRLVDVTDYPINNSDEFIGFVCGIISQDNDIEQMYVDSFLKVAKLEEKDITNTINELDIISEKFQIDFILSISKDEEDLPKLANTQVIVSL